MKHLRHKVNNTLFSCFSLLFGKRFFKIEDPRKETKNWSPTALSQKCWFCNFHAVFVHFAQNTPSLVKSKWETLICALRITNNLNVFYQVEAKNLTLGHSIIKALGNLELLFIGDLASCIILVETNYLTRGKWGCVNVFGPNLAFGKPNESQMITAK